MIHLDNNLVSYFARNRKSSQKLNQFLHDNKEFVLYSDMLLTEATGGAYKKDNEERVSFLRRVPLKRAIVRKPSIFYEIELLELFERGRAPTKDEFFTRYTHHLNKQIWESYFGLFKRLNERARRNLRSGKMAYAHIKDASEDWKILQKIRMREFFFPPKDAPIADAEFIEQFKARSMSKVKLKASDRDAYLAYASAHTDKQIVDGGRKNLEDIIEILAIFDLEFEKICEMDFMSFFKYESYLKSVYKLSKKFNPSVALKFRHLMKTFSFDTPAGFSLHWHCYQLRHQSPDFVKPSDANDLYYLMFFPYTTIFTCDAAMKDTITRSLRNLTLPNDIPNILTRNEFLKLIGDTEYNHH